MKQFLIPLGAALLFSGLWTGSVQAADIFWASASLTTGQASDVSTVGTLVEASSNSPLSPIVNDVTFTDQGAGISYNGFNLDYTGHAYTPSTWVSPDAGMVALVGGSAWGFTGNSITLGNLTVGRQYAVQIFMPAWDSNWQTSFTGGANTSEYVYPAGAAGTGPSNPTPQYIAGTFTADNASQLIVTAGGNPSYTVVAAVQVRDVSAVPEPAAWAMMLAGLGVFGAALHAGRRPDQRPL